MDGVTPESARMWVLWGNIASDVSTLVNTALQLVTGTVITGGGRRTIGYCMLWIL